jgi:hypothetical protein
VSWNNERQAWKASIQVNGKKKYLGKFRTAEEAAIAYNNAAIDLIGPDATLNKVDLTVESLTPTTRRPKVVVPDTEPIEVHAEDETVHSEGEEEDDDEEEDDEEEDEDDEALSAVSDKDSSSSSSIEEEDEQQPSSDHLLDQLKQDMELFGLQMDVTISSSC